MEKAARLSAALLLGSLLCGALGACVGHPPSAAPSAGAPDGADVRRLRVPFRVQEGGTCGLYALGMVMDYYHGRDAANLTAYVAAKDATRRDAATQKPNTDKLIYDVAKANGYMDEGLRINGIDGGLFVADQVGLLARDFGYRYRLIENADAADVRAVIDRGHPALIAYDVDYDKSNQGNPHLAEGKNAHWAVVTGYYSVDGTDWFIAQHGWRTKEYRWRAADLMASSRQVQPKIAGKIVEVFP